MPFFDPNHGWNSGTPENPAPYTDPETGITSYYGNPTYATTDSSGKLPNGRYQISHPSQYPGLNSTFDPVNGNTVSAQDYEAYQRQIQQVSQQGMGDDPWSTILPLVMMAGVGGIAAGGLAAGGAAGAEGAGAYGTAAGALSPTEYMTLQELAGTAAADSAANGAAGFTGGATGSALGSGVASDSGGGGDGGGGDGGGGDSVGSTTAGGNMVDYGRGADFNEFAADYGVNSGGLVSSGGAGSSTWLDSLLTPQSLISNGLRLAGGLIGANASDKAAQAQLMSNALAQAQQQQMYNQTRADQEPFRQVGLGVLPRLSAGLEPGGELTRKFTSADLNADPIYSSSLKTGIERGEAGINARAIGSGMYDSGPTLKALTDWGIKTNQTYGNDAYNRYTADQTGIYNKLAGASGFGQTATNQVQAANTNFGNTSANLATDAGNARAASIVGGTNAWGGAISGIANSINGGSSSDKILAALLGRNSNSFGYA